MKRISLILGFATLLSTAPSLSSSHEYAFIPIQKVGPHKRVSSQTVMKLSDEASQHVESFFITEHSQNANETSAALIKASAFLKANNLPQEPNICVSDQIEGWMALMHWELGKLQAEAAKDDREKKKFLKDSAMCLEASCEFGNPNALVLRVKHLTQGANPHFETAVALIDDWASKKHIRAMQLKRDGLAAEQKIYRGYCGYEFDPLLARKINEELIAMGSIEAREYRRRFAKHNDSLNSPYRQNTGDFVRLTDELAALGYVDAYQYKVWALLMGTEAYHRDLAEARAFMWDATILARVPNIKQVAQTIYDEVTSEFRRIDAVIPSKNQLLIDWLADMLNFDWAIERRLAHILTGTGGYAMDILRAEEQLGQMSLPQLEFLIQVVEECIKESQIVDKKSALEAATAYLTPLIEKKKSEPVPETPRHPVLQPYVSKLPEPTQDEMGYIRRLEALKGSDLAAAALLLPKISDLKALLEAWQSKANCAEFAELIEERLEELPLTYEQVVEGYERILTDDPITRLKFAIMKGYVPRELSYVMGF